MKTISKAELISMKVYETGLNRFIEQTNNTDKPVLISELFNGKNTVSDLIWLAGEICDIEKIRKFARDIALINIELIKPHCSDSDYKLILNFLETGENAATARSAIYITRATHAARDARDAAACAADAADSATHTNNYAAVYAVYTACAAYAVEEIDFTPYLEELFS
jgi:hypothetical protein